MTGIRKQCRERWSAGGFPFELEVEYRVSQPAIVRSGNPEPVNIRWQLPTVAIGSSNGYAAGRAAWLSKQWSPLQTLITHPTASQAATSASRRIGHLDEPSYGAPDAFAVRCSHDRSIR